LHELEAQYERQSETVSGSELDAVYSSSVARHAHATPADALPCIAAQLHIMPMPHLQMPQVDSTGL